MTKGLTKIRMVELFAGIGATHQALKELGLNVDVIAISDIDRNAIKGYEAIHGPVNNLGDITKIEKLPACDLLTYTWPCQAVSVAGKQEGMKEGTGTTSALLWEVGRLLRISAAAEQLPPVLLAENVDAVLNARNYPEFKRWIITLANLGYTTSYRVLNAKNYGTPQNRRRLFVVSTLNLGALIFPKPCPDGRILKDVLEGDVDESFFMSKERLATAGLDMENGQPVIRWPANTKKGFMNASEGDGLVINRPNKARGTVQKQISPTLTTGNGGGCGIVINNKSIPWPCGTGAGYIMAEPYDGLKVIPSPCMHGSAGTVQKQISPTINTKNGGGAGTIEDDLRIRFLTPRECLRLQCFNDEAIDRLSQVLPKTALYKVAGNTIPVCVLKAIFKAIYIDQTFKKAHRQVSLDFFEIPQQLEDMIA